jgi:outer membrane protein assembly factor BamE (lipoprotein component of BamABCDE complex)
MMTQLIRRWIALTLLAILFTACSSNNAQVQFDSAKWKTADKGENNARFLMVDSLSKHLKAGTSQSQVHEQLGNPDANSEDHPDGWLKSKTPFDAYQTRFYYNIIDYDTDYFIIEYDLNGNLLSTHTGTVPG